jgi:hypothetical protein
MDTVIGIGPDGCRIADEFAKYPQYDVYKISTGINGQNCFALQEKNTPEEYENSVPDLTQFFSDVEGDVLFVIGGGSKISGASLQIMKYIKDKNIHVLYKRPVLSELNKTSLLQEKLTYNVFQEYARSGIFKKLFIVSEENVEEVIGDVSILDFKNAVDKQIVNVIHYTNIFQNTEAVLDNSEPPKEIARICTFGTQDMQSGEEKQFFNLQNICDKIYFFAIKEEDLKSDKKLIKNIREQLSKNEIRPSYRVHSTKHPQSFCYFISYSSRIQEG